jgi:hypothetical protein
VGIAQVSGDASESVRLRERVSTSLVWGFVAALCVALPTLISGKNFGPFFLTLLLLLCVTFVVLVAAIVSWRKWRSSVLLLAAYALSLCFFVKCADPIRDYARWVFEGNHYRALVLSQNKAQGQLQHVEWDGWGGPGSDTTAYLVFDPTDSLAGAVHSHLHGKLLGIPCGVSDVRRFSRQWYEATMYTDTDWDHCD